VLATTETGEQLEFDVEPERAVKAGEGGFVTLRRAKVFAV
jgi:sulfate transport system ATP-binding protein